MIGRKILGRYKIVERIGGGGMGVVWKANDLILDRHVALKILRPEMSEEMPVLSSGGCKAAIFVPSQHSEHDVGEDQVCISLLWNWWKGKPSGTN